MNVLQRSKSLSSRIRRKWRSRRQVQQPAPPANVKRDRRPADRADFGGQPRTLSRHEFLAGLHEVLAPRTYLEIGINKGHSLTLSRVPTVGVDPAFSITSEIHCPVSIAKTTSDEFFSRESPVEFLNGVPVDLALVDGMHLAEYALRDVINAEKVCSTAGVIVVDDMLPRNIDEAARERIGKGAWTGDVYKIAAALRSLRPDLVQILVNSRPTGVLVILGLDPSGPHSDRMWDTILESFDSPDPQDVPHEVLTRVGAIDPSTLLDSEIWSILREMRDAEPAAIMHKVSPAIAQLY